MRIAVSMRSAAGIMGHDIVAIEQEMTMFQATSTRQPTLFGIALPVLCSAMIIPTAGLILLAWLAGMDADDWLFRVLLQMKANTAFCILMLGLALALAMSESRGQIRAPVSITLLSLIPICIVTITLFEYGLAWDSGISRLFSPDTRSIVAPGRMAPLTTVAILLLSLALLVQRRASPRAIQHSQLLALTSMTMAIVILLGYLYGASSILQLFGHIPMARSTAILILLLAIGVLTLHPDFGPIAPLCSATVSARMGRQLLALVCLSLPFLAWLRMQGQAMQLYSAEFGTALVVVICLVMMSALIMIHTFQANKTEIRLHYLNRVYGVLSEVNALIVRATNQEELFTEAHRIAIERGAFPRAWLGLVNADRTAVVLVAGNEKSRLSSERLDARLSLKNDPGGQSPIARAVKFALPVVSNDVAAERDDPFLNELLAHNIRSFAVFPLVLGGKVIGIFKLHAEVPNFFHKEELRLLAELAGDIAFAVHHLEQKQLLDHLAYFDSLTGLANPRLLEERLIQAIGHAKRQESTLAVIMVDIIAFKAVNEAFGRHVGDETLKEASSRLNAICGDTSSARLGSNLFAIHLIGIDSDAALIKEIDRITAFCFARRFDILGNSFALSARAGIACLGRDGDDTKILLNNAEAALAAAKLTGQRYRFHSVHSNQSNSERLALQTALVQALDAGEFELHYQIKVDSRSFAVTGAEALLRWHSAPFGAIEPSRFIPLLEETGLIEEVGKWALRQANLDNFEYISAAQAGFRIAVNISAAQLLNENFVDTVLSALGDNSGKAEIDLELTESLIMTDIEKSIEKLRQLRQLGIKIAIDDFGTGYSSMAYLAKLPLDYLKIDRAFIKGLPADRECITIISSIVSLGHALGLQIIAEGVENIAQAELLASLGCDQLQGYLFGKGVPISQLLAKIKQPSLVVKI